MKLYTSTKLSAALMMLVMATQLVVARGQGMHGGGQGMHDGGGPWSWNETEDSFHGDGMHDGDSFHGDGMHGHCDHPGNGFFDESLYLTNLTDCSDDFACILHRGRGGNGTFVCRETFHPVTGVPFSRVRCIPTDNAWETDVCGCCGGTCPDPSNTTCLEEFDVEEDNVFQFALGTSESETSDLSSASFASVLAGRAWMGCSIVSLGFTMLMV